MDIDLEIKNLADAWERLGREDPLWAVCVDPRKKDGRWDFGEFYASGRDEISSTMQSAYMLGLTLDFHGVALDFGCGAGRLSAALAEHYDCVVGVDISQAIIDVASRYASGNGRCVYLHNARADLQIFGDDSFDLVYTSLVLQHMSERMALSYVREFLRVVRPGGLVILSVPVAPRWTLKAAVFTLVPERWCGWIQTKLLRYPAPIRMSTMPRHVVETVVGEHDGRIVAILPGHDRSRDWRVAQYVIAGGATARSESEMFACAVDRATRPAPRTS